MFSSTVSRNVWVRIIGRSKSIEFTSLFVCSSVCDCNDCYFVIENNSFLAYCPQGLWSIVIDSSTKLFDFKLQSLLVYEKCSTCTCG